MYKNARKKQGNQCDTLYLHNADIIQPVSIKREANITAEAEEGGKEEKKVCTISKYKQSEMSIERCETDCEIKIGFL